MDFLIDTHIHLDAPELCGQGSDLLPPARQAGIGGFVIPGVRVSGWQGIIDLAKGNEDVYAAPGLHPVYAEQWCPAAAQKLQCLTGHPDVVALGEMGLDAVAGPSLEVQEKAFCDQLQIALDSKLPVLLHCRKTTGRVMELLRDLNVGQRVGGVWHGFSGSLQVAAEIVSLGFKIGVGPILLRGNAVKLPQAVEMLPLEALVLETDLPDMAEKPGALIKVAEKVAELTGKSVAEVRQVTTENASQVFRI